MSLKLGRRPLRARRAHIKLWYPRVPGIEGARPAHEWPGVRTRAMWSFALVRSSAMTPFAHWMCIRQKSAHLCFTGAHKTAIHLF